MKNATMKTPNEPFEFLSSDLKSCSRERVSVRLPCFSMEFLVRLSDDICLVVRS